MRNEFGGRVIVAAMNLVATLGWLGTSNVTAAEVVFRDDFDAGLLEPGWEFIREDASAYSLTANPGFFRILTQRGAVSEGSAIHNLLVRPRSGDFILQTRLEFNPQLAREFAGLLVYVDDENAIALGLAYASGERGVFRGIGMVSLASGSTGAQRPAAFYDEDTSDNPNVVFLRLLRSGDQFVAGYSADGITFTDVGSVTNALPDRVLVGIGGTNGDFEECGADCDVSIPADFDYFQISSLGDDDPLNGVTLDAVTLDGPAEVVGGGSGTFVLNATFSDGSSLDVTEDAEWTVAPAELGEVIAGTFSAADVEQTSQATIVASYTKLTSGGAATRTDSLLVRITAPPRPSSGQPRACGFGGILGLLVVMVFMGRVGLGGVFSGHDRR